MQQLPDDRTHTHALSQVFFLAPIAMFSLLSRVVLSPLLPALTNDLGLTIGAAGSLFLYVSIGFTTAMLASGFVVKKLRFRFSILASTLTAGSALTGMSFCAVPSCVRIFLLLLGAGTGLYLPSAMGAITAMIRDETRGKAIAIHEIGFNLSFISAPLLARLMLPTFSWRDVFRIIAGLIVASGLVYVSFGKGGRQRGAPPHPVHVKHLFSRSFFWIIAILFGLAIGAEMGVYSLIPTYLAEVKGMRLDRVNTLLGLSRISGIPMIFLTGWLVDRVGFKPLLYAILVSAGTFTALIGLTSGMPLILAVFLQPLFIICFFPAALSGMAEAAPSDLVSLAVSLMIPFSYLFGAGLVPAGIGLLGETGRFSIGFVLTGFGLLAGLLPLTFLRLRTE